VFPGRVRRLDAAAEIVSELSNTHALNHDSGWYH
jgi:hypothetical protein